MGNEVILAVSASIRTYFFIFLVRKERQPKPNGALSLCYRTSRLPLDEVFAELVVDQYTLGESSTGAFQILICSIITWFIAPHPKAN
jgi:hypothetical protein